GRLGARRREVRDETGRRLLEPVVPDEVAERRDARRQQDRGDRDRDQQFDKRESARLQGLHRWGMAWNTSLHGRRVLAEPRRTGGGSAGSDGGGRRAGSGTNSRLRPGDRKST